MINPTTKAEARQAIQEAEQRATAAEARCDACSSPPFDAMAARGYAHDARTYRARVERLRALLPTLPD